VLFQRHKGDLAASSADERLGAQAQPGVNNALLRAAEWLALRSNPLPAKRALGVWDLSAVRGHNDSIHTLKT